VPPAARSVVFLLDCSISMGPSGALEAARAELLACLRRLGPATSFQVIPYNLLATPLPLSQPAGLVRASPTLVERAAQLLAELCPSGGTDHCRALRAGLLLRPEVLYLVTDADDLGAAALGTAARFNRARTTIHVIELNRGHNAGPDSALRRLAAEHGGTYRRVAPGG
jgi:hypothetical protein